MTLRLIDMILSNQDSEKIQKLLQPQDLIDIRCIRLPEEKILVRITLEAEQSEAVFDILENQFTTEGDATRIVMLPVQAILPRSKEVEEKKSAEHVARAEIYEKLRAVAQPSWVYLTLTLLSTILMATGLYENQLPIIIGAMLIAPFLGPNIACALGVVLGDLSLLGGALFTSFVGIASSILLSALIGLFIQSAPAIEPLSIYTSIGVGQFVVACASGCAGVLAFTSGVPITLVGVMAAVALAPPLVILGLLLGTGEFALAKPALYLFLINLLCVNFTAILTFFIQGIRPAKWWEKERAKTATWIAIPLFLGLLLILLGLIFLQLTL